MKALGVACIVDDDPIFVFGLSKLMEMTSFCQNLLSFQNGRGAIEYLQAEKSNPERLPDAILLDINMPVMDGWQFMDEFVALRGSLSKHVRVFMVSSSVSDADISKARSYEEITEYLVKPLKSADLVRLVETYFR